LMLGCAHSSVATFSVVMQRIKLQMHAQTCTATKQGDIQKTLIL